MKSDPESRPALNRPIVLRAGAALALVVFAGCGGKNEADEDERPAARARAAAGASLTLSSAARAAAGIEVAAATRRRVLPGIDVSGTLRPDAQRSVTVRARTGGRILEVLADVGSRVARGQTLATLEGADVTAALARYRAAAAREAAARQSLERAERLLTLRAISRAERDSREAEAQAAGAEAAAARQDLTRLGLDPRTDAAPDALTELSVRSPLSGTVTQQEASRASPCSVCGWTATAWPGPASPPTPSWRWSRPREPGASWAASTRGGGGTTSSSASASARSPMRARSGRCPW